MILSEAGVVSVHINHPVQGILDLPHSAADDVKPSHGSYR